VDEPYRLVVLECVLSTQNLCTRMYQIHPKIFVCHIHLKFLIFWDSMCHLRQNSLYFGIFLGLYILGLLCVSYPPKISYILRYFWDSFMCYIKIFLGLLYVSYLSKFLIF
jgi:hypothetical protein